MQSTILGICVLLGLLVTAPLSTQLSAQPFPQNAADPQIESLRKQLEKHYGLLSGTMYTLTHAAESQDEVMRFLTTISFVAPAEARDPQMLPPDVNTVPEFKAKIAGYLDSPDDVVCATAAIFLGAIGDAAYVARLVDELHSTRVRKGFGEERICRGRVAMALGLLKAREHALPLVLLLQSKNSYDRQGATMALGLMKAREHAKDVAVLLNRLYPRKPTDEFDSSSITDDSAIVALMEMGVGADYTSEFAVILKNRSAIEPSTTAMFALARVGTMDHAGDIAALLDDRFRKGDAAIALAILQAKEYVKPIAKLLEDESPLIRKDAALALALMNATDTTGEIARLLTATEDFVRYYAAVALTLLDAQKYSKQILAIVQPYHAKGYHLNESDLHHLLADDFVRMRERFYKELGKLEGK